MIPTHDNLINSTEKYQKYHSNLNLIYVYNHIVRRPDNLIKMADASNAGLPALSAICTEIESYYDSLSAPTFDIINDNFARTYIGRMISVVLAELGYKKVSSTRMPKTAHSKYFSSASRYELLNPSSATLKITKQVVDIETNTVLR